MNDKTARASVLKTGSKLAVTQIRYKPNYEDPRHEVESRLMELQQPWPRCVFLNPIATVMCSGPTRGFFRIARARQCEWCKKTKYVFPREIRSSVKKWFNPNTKGNREERYIDRAFCFIGVLFIEDEYVPPSIWPDLKWNPNRKQRLKNKKKENKKSPDKRFDSLGVQGKPKIMALI